MIFLPTIANANAEFKYRGILGSRKRKSEAFYGKPELYFPQTYFTEIFSLKE